MDEINSTPPRLADMGLVFWGPDWIEPMAFILEVTKEEVVAWDARPETMPPDLEVRVREIGAVRIQEIEQMIAQLDAMGLRRGPNNQANL
jgi:hypothetical protein